MKLGIGAACTACLVAVVAVAILDMSGEISLKQPPVQVSLTTPGLKPGEAVGAEGLVLASAEAPAEAASVQVAAAPAAAPVEPNAAEGRRLFNQCAACHLVTEANNRVGPHLVDIYGRQAGVLDGFRYSPALAGADFVWNTDTLTRFLRNPQEKLPGNRMTFRGVRDEAAIQHIIAYLKDPQT